MENEGKFRVSCEAASAGCFRAVTESLSVHIGQRVRSEGREDTEIWDSVLITCAQSEDGSLEVQIRAFHPDCDEGRSIALIRSRPDHNDIAAPTLTFELGQTHDEIA